MGPIDLATHPGHLFRRVQQVHTLLWTSLTSQDVTPPQFAVLNGLAADPGIDQRSLARAVALDRSTAADVISRLVKRDLVQRERDSSDGRRNVLRLTEAGAQVHDELVHRTEHMIEILLAPLEGDERDQLLGLLSRVAEAGEQLPHPDELPG
ncbi:MarR family winged helix-turn-helix transcriptional regulator [Parasphingorhabdus pacifica]